MKLPAFNKLAECGLVILSFRKVAQGLGGLVVRMEAPLSWLGAPVSFPGD